ncbi:aminodeoxychorismate lyase [Actinophytocola xinjiangensis]|uniref:Endolytic murein transglycosylase n=1 Tax=Actinophytocola xinjiangensis TaxID=485602 RepID=A0A7Z0WS31_9PSEU|nr:endolytic transglycosylase MltG [Actinophytocola xinjiangensis]OLF13709.1 aminodeoxychorismate lyase [Actinophytocola xinjiangensis]
MSNDDLDLFDPHTDRRQPVRRPKKRKKRRTVLWVSMGVLLVLIAGGGYYGIRQIVDIGSYDDFSGAGESDVVIRVKKGDSTGDIASTLVDAGVVASSSAFVAASETDGRVRQVQPGYYVMKTKSSGEAAVGQIVTPEARVGNLQIKPGTQLHDITKTDGGVIPGVVSLIATASCAELNGEKTCVEAKQLWATAEKGDLAKLGVPDWAQGPASRATPQRRLEGLVMPGVYDVRPGATADELWKELVTDSATRMQAVGMPNVAEETGFTPYQVLVMASLIEREAIEKDFGKISRVTYNRLIESMPLQYDSTVNYVLDRPTIRTDSSERAKPGPYNSYLNTGLVPTPISSPSENALKAAVTPEKGEWLYFVRCQTDGSSCFAATHDEHRQNVREAEARGAY